MNQEHQVVTVRENGRRRVQTVNTMESKTVQADKNKADIRHILAKYEVSGVLMNMQHVDLQYRDVSEFTDFADLMEQSRQAEIAFMKLPSKLRRIFDNRVENWLDAAHDPEKLDELRPQLEKLGLLEAVAEPPKADPPPPSE